MTVRQLYETLKADNEAFLDVELLVTVRARGTIAHGTTPGDMWGFPRIAPIPQTNEPARLSMDVYLPSEYVISKRKTK